MHLLATEPGVIAARVDACRSLLDAGVRLPAEVTYWLSVDEQLLEIPLQP